MTVLRQSTAVDVLIGPFVDETDGFTAEAGLTINQASVLLSKNGQALTQKSDVTAAANDAGAYYNCELDTTDTNTVGSLVVTIHVAGARPVTQYYQVIEEAIYDAIYVAAADGFDASGKVSLLAATQASIDAIEMDTGTTLPASIAVVDGNVDSILVDTGTTLDAALAVVDANVDAILVDTGTTLPAAIAVMDANVDQIETAVITNATSTDIAADIIVIDGLIDQLITAVVTVSGEPAQGAPAASASMQTKLNHLYKAWRNKTTQTATAFKEYDDAGTTVDHKSTLSDDGTTFTSGEIVSGP